MESVGYWAVVLGAVVQKGTQRALSPFDLTPTEFLILHMCHWEQNTTVTDLARVSPLEISAISRQVEGLHTRGLLDRRRSREDRRVVFLELSEEGRLLMPELYRATVTVEDRIVQDMSPEEREFLLNALGALTIDLVESQRLLEP